MSTRTVSKNASTSAKQVAADHRRHRRSSTLRIRVAQVGLVVLWLAAWELTVRSGIMAPVLAKSPVDSWNYLAESTASGELASNLGASMVAVMLAWVIAGVVGVVAGIAVGLMPVVERVIDPFVDALNAMPRIALAPLFIVIFGITMTAKVALAVTLVFFIVFSGTRAGVRSTDSELLRLSTVLGARPRQLFTKVLFPVATPAIFAALRLGLVYSFLGVVGSELIAARDGLGQLVAMYSATFHMEAVYAILIVLAVVAMVLNQFMGMLERRLLRWQPPADR